MERRTTITIYGDDMCTHFWQRCHDSLHRSSLYRSIACQSNVKVLSCQNTGDQSGRSSAVTTIEDINWFAQTMKTFSVNKYSIFCPFNGDAHTAKTSNSRETVSTFQKVCDFSCALCQRTKHNCAMGDGFISGNGYSSVKVVFLAYLHVFYFLPYTV